MKTSYLETEIGNEIYSPVEIDIKKIKREISELRKEMEANGVRQISCFNAGLTSREYLYNSQLFCLKTKLAKISAQKQVEPSK